MVFTRRSILATTAGIATFGTVLTDLQGTKAANFLPPANHVGVAIDVGDDQSFNGLSNTVTIEKVEDPFGSGSGSDTPGNGKGSSKNGRGTDAEGVVHITSQNSRAESEPTFDIGMSLIDVSDEDLMMSELATDGGFEYEWARGEADTVGVRTDHEQPGSPDNVWLFLEPDEDKPAKKRAAPFYADAKPVFRTLYADSDAQSNGYTDGFGAKEWNTRMVSAELGASSGWKELSLDGRTFSRVGESVVDAYGDREIRGVGISRGDPFWGPSHLDSYYRNLTLAGQKYVLPTKFNFGKDGLQ